MSRFRSLKLCAPCHISISNQVVFKQQNHHSPFSSAGSGFVPGVTKIEKPPKIGRRRAATNDSVSRNLKRFSDWSSCSVNSSSATNRFCRTLARSQSSETMCTPRAIALRNLQVRYTLSVTSTVHSAGVWTMVPPSLAMFAA